MDFKCLETFSFYDCADMVAAPLLPLAALLTTLVCNKYPLRGHPAHFYMKSKTGIVVLACCPDGQVFVKKYCRCLNKSHGKGLCNA